jgi:hypothetical protein
VGHPLDGIRSKLGRAETHLEHLEREVRAFVEGDPKPYGFSIPYLDPDGGWHVVYGMVNVEPTPVLGVVVGEIVHNLRSALDHLVWQLVILNGKKPRAGPAGNSWPVAITSDEWRKARTSKLWGVKDRHRTIIGKVQPYKAGPPVKARRTIPAQLADLSNIDKHQIVHPMFANIREPLDTAFRVVSGPGTIGRVQFMGGGRMKHGAPLIRVTVNGGTDETEVQMDGHVPVDIAFGQPTITFGRLQQITQSCWVILRAFEPEFSS